MDAGVIRYETRPGDHVSDSAGAMAALAREHDCRVEGTFNGIVLAAYPDSNPAEIVAHYSEEIARRAEAYRSSPEGKAAAAARAEAERQRQCAHREAVATAVPAMSVRDPEKWAKWIAANNDPYGKAAVEYAERWARIMEGRMGRGATLEECAEETSHAADSEGITGFMYGCAVAMLAEVWEHGEALRRWHNLKTQIGDEGERTNESGGTLNPALLSVKED